MPTQPQQRVQVTFFVRLFNHATIIFRAPPPTPCSTIYNALFDVLKAATRIELRHFDMVNLYRNGKVVEPESTVAEEGIGDGNIIRVAAISCV